MEIFDGHHALFRPLVTPTLALGNFDGVHRGHQELLHRAVGRAREHRGEAVVLTFDPHPAAILSPAGAPPLLTPLARKLELFDACGLDACIIEPFTHALAELAPDTFAQQILVDVIGARHAVVGYDFAYGSKRAGTPDRLRAFGADRGIHVDIIPPVTIHGEVASSSRIRSHLAAGDAVTAARLLGRPFDLDGVVIHGVGRGRSIGIPTANVQPMLEPPRVVMPAPGVYAVTLARLEATAETGGAMLFAGAANLGTNPTFSDGGASSLEVHLLGVHDPAVLGPDGHLYGQRVRVAFIERIRPEHRFSSVDELVGQIRADIVRAGEILGLDGAYTTR
jgi:riboflavin kinase/FMN adenylyltransferase